MVADIGFLKQNFILQCQLMKASYFWVSSFNFEVYNCWWIFFRGPILANEGRGVTRILSTVRWSEKRYFTVWQAHGSIKVRAYFLAPPLFTWCIAQRIWLHYNEESIRWLQTNLFACFSHAAYKMSKKSWNKNMSLMEERLMWKKQFQRLSSQRSKPTF